MIALYLAAGTGIVGVFAVLVYVLRQSGKDAVLKEQAVRNAEVKTKQLDAVTNASSARDSLRDGSF